VFDYEKTSYASEQVLPLEDLSLRVLKVRRALESFELGPGALILDLGCGEGALARTLNQRLPELEVHACDVSLTQLEKARNLGGEVIYRECGDSLPYEDHFFDAVFVMDVLEHVEDASAFLDEVSRILRPGGRLLLHCPCEGQPGTLHWLCWKLGIVPNLKREVAGHVQRFTLRGVVAQITEKGFACRRRRYCYHPFGQLFDLLAFWRQKCQMDMRDGKTGRGGRLMLSLPWYRVFPAMERLAGLEARILGRIPLAMGLDAWFEKV
jgi:SAM-dependent methyltransferase